MEVDGTPEKFTKYQHGSIIRLFLRDFMQYSAAEMRPGPSLNVIIGPNGAGKSSVINGLALALGKLMNQLKGAKKSCIPFVRGKR